MESSGSSSTPTFYVKNTFLEIEQPGNRAAGARSKSAEPPTKPKALFFEPAPCINSGLPEEIGVAAPNEHPGGNPEDAPHQDEKTGSNRRQRKRRGRKPVVPLSHSSASALMAHVEQPANIQEVFFFAARADAPLSFETIVEVLRAAAKKAEPCPGGVPSLPGFQRCMEELRPKMGSVNLAGPQLYDIPKLFWSLGKLEVGTHAGFFLEHAKRLVPGNVHRFSTPEISNSLWGLAKLVTPRMRPFYEGLAMLFVTELSVRMDKLTSQCIANSVYSVAQLQLRSPDSRKFLQACVSKIVDGSQDLREFTTQGVANTIWALAKMPPGSILKPSIWSLLLQARTGSQDRLEEFNPQELSMFAWAVAQLSAEAVGNPYRRQQVAPEESSIESFIVDISRVARNSIQRLSPQSVSNVAYALCKAHALGDMDALLFIAAAATQGVAQITDWQPQAISNFCYVLGQLPGVASKKQSGNGQSVANVQHILTPVKRFAEVASMEAERRMNEFNWQDLSGIISALGKGTLVSSATVHMVAEVVRASSGHCYQMSTQSMLNITMNALELGISTQIVQPMISDVAGCIASRTPRVKEIDLKQWRKIQALSSFESESKRS